MHVDLMQNGKLPEKLDLNDWIQNALDSEEETDRQIALEELASTGVPPYLAARIREISARDSSEVCRQLALWIQSIEHARSELKPQLKKLELSPVNIILLLENAEAATATVLLQMLRKAPTPEVLEQWRKGLRSEQNPRMLQVGLTLLGKFGEKSDAEEALVFLEHQDTEVVCAAFSLLQNQHPELFKQQISRGLTSKSLQIQLHSVHLLRAIDLEESIQYIQAFLFNRNPLVRQKALRELMLVPFERVNTIFLQYLSREIQPLLLVKAGFVIAFNPLPDFPVKLFDIFQLSREVKKHILQLILKQVVESIQSAGVLKQTFDEYMLELKQKINLKRSELVIRCALKDLVNDDKNMRLSAIDRLAPYSEYPSILQALNSHLTQERDEDVKAAIEAITGSQVAAQPEEEKADPRAAEKLQFKAIPKIEEFLALNPKSQRIALKRIRSSDDWSASRGLVTRLLSEDLKKNVQLEIIRLFGQFGSRIDTPSVVDFLEDSDPSIVAAAIKTIGTIDIDVMLPHLNRFLADEDPRIKSAALEIYVLADKEGALQYLASMLKSTTLATRRVGLSLLPQIDYPSAEPLIWRLLKYEGNNELKIQAAYMVAANPTKEGLYKLFAISHKKEGDLKEGYDELWKLALVSAESLFASTREEIEIECWEAFKADSEKQTEEKSSYSYSKVVGDADVFGMSPEKELAFIEVVFLHLQEFKAFYVSGLLFLLPIIYVLYSSTPASGPVQVQSRKSNAAGKVKFMPTQKSMSTQVGSDDWKGTLKSGARELLSGPAYTAALKSGVREVESFRANYERDYRQYLIDKANDESEPEETRKLYEAHLNHSFANAVKAWDSGNMSEAELYFERAVEDQQLNSVGRCFALQKLAELAEAKKDQSAWLRWQDRLLKELQKLPGYEGVEGLENFGQTYLRMLEVSQHLRSGGDSQPVMNHLRRTGESEAQARESIEALKNIDSFFPGR